MGLDVIISRIYCRLINTICFCRCSIAGGSFGEMLLLVAIHFHSNQTHAIADLVSSTLGMKVRSGFLNLCYLTKVQSLCLENQSSYQFQFTRRKFSLQSVKSIKSCN